jgi:cyclic beta-1,2-glucan synthetase
VERFDVRVPDAAAGDADYENTLLDQTCKAAVARQIEYGKQRGVPWGVSESGYNTVDVHLNYQYRAFGVPGLGLKRGLAEIW